LQGHPDTDDTDNIIYMVVFTPPPPPRRHSWTSMTHSPTPAKLAPLGALWMYTRTDRCMTTLTYTTWPFYNLICTYNDNRPQWQPQSDDPPPILSLGGGGGTRSSWLKTSQKLHILRDSPFIFTG
jgi:hypothetical protein